MKPMDAIKNLTPKQRKGVTGGAVAVTVLLVGLLGIWPQIQSITDLKAKGIALDGELAIAQAKMKRLDQLINENKRLQTLLEQQKRQLPDTFEVDTLLKQISNSGSRAGLSLQVWRPDDEKQNPNCLYQELPIHLEVEGSYHQLGVFFEYLGQLDRIVNFSKVHIKADKNKESSRLSTGFTATAFAAPPPGAEAAGTCGAAEKPGAKGKGPTPPGAKLTEKGH